MKELIVVEELQSNATLFVTKNSVEPILKQIAERALSIVPDLTTEQGRKDIASLAFKVARSKTILDDIGKDKVAGLKKEVKKIDEQRKLVRDTLDELKARVRQPLTDFEERQAKRISDLQNRITNMEAFADERDQAGRLRPASDLRISLKRVQNIKVDDSWEEFISMAQTAKDQTIQHLNRFIEQREAEEALAAENERLRQEQEAAAQKKREEELKKQTEEEVRQKVAREQEQADKAKAAKEAAAAAAKKKAESTAAFKKKEAARIEKIDMVILKQLDELIPKTHANKVWKAIKAGKIDRVSISYV